jgi:hypothetical protein
MVLPLIILTFIVYFFLWIGDFYLTLKTVKKLGPSVELNPLVKRIFKLRGKYLWAFKAVEFLAFLYLIFYLTYFFTELPIFTLIFFILAYGFIVANNSHVYFVATNQENKILYFIFLALVFITVSLIYLNYVLFKDVSKSYEALSECKTQLGEISRICQAS